MQRRPRGLRPYRRAILVLSAVSSMKTSRAGSHSGWWLRHQARAAATSGLSCSAARVVFFIAKPQIVELVPQGRVGDADAKLLLKPLPHLRQG